METLIGTIVITVVAYLFYLGLVDEEDRMRIMGVSGIWAKPGLPVKQYSPLRT